MRVQSAAGSSPFKYCLHKWVNKYGSRGHPIKHGHTFYQNANYSQFILNQNQEVGQKPIHTATLKNLYEYTRVRIHQLFSRKFFVFFSKIL